jgi:sec-independent protein translocase protein TatA
MGNIGVPELIVIFVVALLVFGPKKLPEIGKSLGKGLREFQKARNELVSTIEDEVRNIHQDTVQTAAADHNPPAGGQSSNSTNPLG